MPFEIFKTQTFFKHSKFSDVLSRNTQGPNRRTFSRLRRWNRPAQRWKRGSLKSYLKNNKCFYLFSKQEKLNQLTPAIFPLCVRWECVIKKIDFDPAGSRHRKAKADALWQIEPNNAKLEIFFIKKIFSRFSMIALFTEFQ